MKYSMSLLWLALAATQCLPQTSLHLSQKSASSTDQFRLLTRPKGFLLQFVSNGKTKQIGIPRDWLIPPQEEKDEEFNYVGSFQYDREITSFPVGNGEIGLHVSSYDVAREGTSHAAAGRDVFLIFDPASLALTNGGISRGVTKWRVRSEGCLGAAAEHYLLADIDSDGLIDVGVIKDEIECVDRYDQAEDKEWKEPRYKQYPATWYVLRGNAWQLESSYAGKIPSSAIELPLIGMAASDVDDVPLGMWRSFDPSKRLELDGPPPAYIPPYWKEQIHKPAAEAVQALEPADKRLARLHQ